MFANGGAQEYCNRTWVFILRPGLALPRRPDTLILPLPAQPPNPTQPLPWCHPETRWLWCQQDTRRTETESQTPRRKKDTENWGHVSVLRLS